MVQITFDEIYNSLEENNLLEDFTRYLTNGTVTTELTYEQVSTSYKGRMEELYNKYVKWIFSDEFYIEKENELNAIFKVLSSYNTRKKSLIIKKIENYEGGTIEKVIEQLIEDKILFQISDRLTEYFDPKTMVLSSIGGQYNQHLYDQNKGIYPKITIPTNLRKLIFLSLNIVDHVEYHYTEFNHLSYMADINSLDNYNIGIKKKISKIAYDVIVEEIADDSKKNCNAIRSVLEECLGEILIKFDKNHGLSRPTLEHYINALPKFLPQKLQHHKEQIKLIQSLIKPIQIIGNNASHAKSNLDFEQYFSIYVLQLLEMILYYSDIILNDIQE